MIRDNSSNFDDNFNESPAIPLPMMDFFDADDQVSIVKGNPQDAYRALAKANINQLYNAVPEEVLKRAKHRNRLDNQSLNIKIYSVLSALNHSSSNKEVEVCRAIVNNLGEMLIAKSGKAGCDRIAHHALSKFTLDNKNEIPENYSVVDDTALSSGMITIAKKKYSGLSHHSGGFKLKFEGMLRMLAVILQLPDKNLADPFELKQVDEKGKEIIFYLCSLKDLRDKVFQKFDLEEQNRIFLLNNRKVVVSLYREKIIRPALKIDDSENYLSEVEDNKSEWSSSNPALNLDELFGAAITPEKERSDLFASPKKAKKIEIPQSSKRSVALCSPESHFS